MKIREANKLITEYMKEDILRIKGYVAIKRNNEEIPVGYHTKSEWLLPVLLKLQQEGNLSEKLELSIFEMYSDGISSLPQN